MYYIVTQDLTVEVEDLVVRVGEVQKESPSLAQTWEAQGAGDPNLATAGSSRSGTDCHLTKRAYQNLIDSSASNHNAHTQ